MQQEGVYQYHVSGFARELQESVAFFYVIAKSYILQNTLRILPQKTCHVFDRVWCDECSSALRENARPNYDCEQALFGVVKEVAKEITVLVLATYFSGGLLPGAVFSKAEIDDEAVSPSRIFHDPIHATKQVTYGSPGLARHLRDVYPIHLGEMDSFFKPGPGSCVL